MIEGKGLGHEDTPWYMRRHMVANTFTTCVLYTSPLYEMAALLNWMHAFVYYYLSHDDVIHQRHRPGGKSRTNPAVRAGKVTSAPNTSIYGYIN